VADLFSGQNKLFHDVQKTDGALDALSLSKMDAKVYKKSPALPPSACLNKTTTYATLVALAAAAVCL
jgi:hypothetical protein